MDPIWYLIGSYVVLKVNKTFIPWIRRETSGMAAIDLGNLSTMKDFDGTSTGSPLPIHEWLMFMVN